MAVRLNRNDNNGTTYYINVANHTLMARHDFSNCGLINIASLSFGTMTQAKTVFRSLKRQASKTSTANSPNLLYGRNMLIGTINQSQYTTCGKILRDLGFKLSKLAVNRNSHNQCYTVTGDLTKLKLTK